MTRPNTQHKGFFVPNASGVLDPVMAEPDQIDYNIAGNSRWGVVTGCEVTVSAGTTAEVTEGIAVVDGLVVNVTGGQTLSLGSGSSQPRFDLIGVDEAGMLTVQAGSPAADPVFPDPDIGFTTLAVVLAPAGATSFGDYVVDKRHLLPIVLVGDGSGDDTLVLNRSGGVDTFRINAEGRIEWDNADATLSANSGTVTISDHLVVTGDMTVDGYMSLLHDLSVHGNVVGDNFQRNDDFPTTASEGTILVRAGLLYVRRAGAWEQMLTTGTGGDQVGDIKQSMRTPAQMPGWLQMSGQPIDEATYPQLFGVGGLAGYISGVSPDRTMTLPDASDRFLLSGNSPGATGGSSTFSVALANMPAHIHDVVLAESADHTHVATASSVQDHIHQTQQFPVNVANSFDGRHSHNVIDPGHIHTGADGWAGVSNWPFVALAWGGRNKLDGPINDASHTYAVEPMNNTVPAYSGISISRSDSQHEHITTGAGGHTHPILVSATGRHSHAVTQQSKGGGTPITFRPKYLTVFTYIKL